MRRPLLILTAAIVALATMVLPAAAAGVTWLSPGAGAVVSGDVDLAVRIDRQFGETVDGVTARLSVDGSSTAPGTRTRDLRCAEAEGCNTVRQSQDRWGLVQLGPDGGELAAGPVCNGQYVLQVRPSTNQDWAGIPVVLTDRTVPTVSGLTVNGRSGATFLSWTPPRTAGDVDLRIERRPEGSSSWDVLAVLPGSASSYADQGLAAGTYDYRVTSTRGDGFVSGRPVAACADDEPDHVMSSPSHQAVVAPGPTPTSSPSTDPSGTSDGTAAGVDGDAEDGSHPSTTPDDGPTDGTTSDEEAQAGQADDDGAVAGSGSNRSRIAPPPPARRSNAEVRAPEIARPGPAGESYYGEGDAFSEELEYGAEGPVALETEESSTLGRFVPGGVRTLTEIELDRRQVVLPIAVGLLLLACAMHVRRWMGSA